MTAFEDFRKTVFQKGVLSFFGELVELTGQNGTESIRVKIEHRQVAPKNQTAGTDSHARTATGTIDQTEQIRVTIDKAVVGYIPRIGSMLHRLSEGEGMRPFVFSGEVEFDCPVHSVLIFQRPLRVSQGRRA